MGPDGVSHRLRHPCLYDTFYMNGTLQRYLSKLVTVLAPVLYGFAMAYLLAPIVNWIEA